VLTVITEAVSGLILKYFILFIKICKYDNILMGDDVITHEEPTLQVVEEGATMEEGSDTRPGRPAPVDRLFSIQA
jgi:hypothetical protein